MADEIVYATPNRITPNRPVLFNPDLCTGCNRCVNTCDADIMIPNPEKGTPPIILFPDECWYCGCCVDTCPEDGAISLNHPLTQRVLRKRKETGEIFRV
ncbi:MAG: ferredoxin family protein [Deltaproteobacteria bacterium]|nr:ferredoxin family protein [Deltaproteobacteria bacterium]MBW2139120.1 ferredoxin family protein [Deltaproteobacteria bacterium]